MTRAEINELTDEQLIAAIVKAYALPREWLERLPKPITDKIRWDLRSSLFIAAILGQA